MRAVTELPAETRTVVLSVAVAIKYPVLSLLSVMNKLLTGPQSPVVALNATIGLVATK